MKFKRNFINFIIFTLFILIILKSILRINQRTGNESFLSVNTPNGEYIYSLSADEIISVQGSIGISRIQIKDGAARFIESTCPNKTCIHSGWVREHTDWAACLPNEVFIHIEDNEPEMDAITR